MALEEINDNFSLRAPKSIDDKYGPVIGGHTMTYTDIAAANAAIPSAYRYLGLTVLIDTGTENKEYWWKDGVADGDLVLKSITAADTWKTILTSSYGTTDLTAGQTGWGQYTGHTDFPATEDTKVYVITEDCSVENLFVRTTGTQPGTGSLVVTVRINAVDTALALTIAAGSSSTTHSNIVDSAALVAGDTLTLRFVNNASSTALRVTSSGVSLIKT